MNKIESRHPIKEYNGFWWIPSDPENQYFGNLRIDENGAIYLQLFGNSRAQPDDYLNQDYGVLYGTCEKGLEITVFELHRLKGSASAFFKSSLEYRFCLIGLHADNTSQIEFDEIRISISDLFGWFVEYETELLYQKKNRHYIENKLYSDNERCISICAGNYESSSSKTQRTEIQRGGYLKLEYNESNKYFEIFEELKLISMLMSVIGRDAIVIQEIIIPHSRKNAQLYINNQTYFSPSIERGFKNKHGRHIITKSFKNILGQFYSLNESEKFILEVVSNKYLRRPGNSRSEFFNTISAYESWHRNNIGQRDDNNVETYERLLKTVEDNKELTEWIGSRSILLKGMSLPKRIDYLMDQDSWGLISDKKKFKAIITATRNMIAHNLKKQKLTASLPEMLIAQNITHVILEKLFLESLGLPDEFISIHTQNHPVVKQTIRLIDSLKQEIRF